MVGAHRHVIIAEQLRKKIESGALKEGAQLPTELELQEEYKASRNTVRNAVKSLVNRGLVEARPGLGTFVIERVVPFVITLTQDPETGLGGGEGQAYVREIRAQGRTPTASEPHGGFLRATAGVAAALDLPVGADVIIREQRLSIDGMPWSIQVSYYPFSFVERGAHRLLKAEDVSEGTVRYLREALGIEQTSYSDRLRIRPVTQEEELFFEGQVGSNLQSVLENRRIAYDSNKKPIRLTVTAFHPDRVEIAIHEGDVPESARTAQTDPDQTTAPGTEA